MKIMVINPNTSQSMTDHIRHELILIKRPDTELAVICPDKGPELIASSYDEAYAVPPMLELVNKANKENYNAIVIACFSDPGLHAAREISFIPVVGIEEFSFHAAAMLGARFSIITPFKARIHAKEEDVYRCGLSRFLASVRSLDLNVAETASNPEKAQKKILKVAGKAVAEDGAEVIILGCAGLTGYSEEIEKKLMIKVIDPTSLAFKYAEAIADLGLAHSKIGFFATPPQKSIKSQGGE